MHRLILTFQAALAGLVFAAATASPAAADTTIAQFDKLSRAEQADRLGTFVQSLAEDLQEHKRAQEAACLTRLYTNEESEARAVESPGMRDFFAALAVAREKGPNYFTIEDIVARQMVIACGTRPSKR